MYQLLESEGSKIIQIVVTTNATTSSEASHFEATNSFLHIIAARPKSLPYIDMVKWIIENINIIDQTFQMSRKMVIGSFTVEGLKITCHVLDPQKVYDKPFLEQFARENDVPSDPIKQRRLNSNKHKHEKSSMYSISSLASPYSYIATMMCRLFDYADTTKFSIEWVPIIDVVVNYL